MRVTHCGRVTYTAIAAIASHSTEKMKSKKASKDGVDRKTLGMRGELPRSDVKREAAIDLTGSKQAHVQI